MLTSNVILAQSTLKLSLETGATFSQLPKLSKKSVNNATVRERDLPLTSPLVGAQVHWTLWKRLSLSSGVQYQQTGRVDKEIFENLEGNFVQIWTVQSRLHQIAFPVSITGRFNIKNFRFNGSLGFRHVRTLDNSLQFRIFEKNQGIETSRNELRGFSAPVFYNALSVNGNDYDKSKSLNYINQATIGLSFPIKSRFDIQTSFNFSDKSYVFESYSTGWCGNEPPFQHFIKGNDFQLILRYYLTGKN